MRLLLISNSTQHGSGYLDHCADEMLDFLGPLRKIVFVPYAGGDWNAYADQFRTRVMQMGLECVGIHENKGALTNLKWADAIFVGGGNTFRLLKTLQDQELIEPLRDAVSRGKSYLGASAGINITCPTIRTTNDMPIVEPESFGALGLVPFQINPHYLDPDPSSTHKGETRQQRLLEFHEMNQTAVLGLREGGILRIEDSNMVLKGSRTLRLFRQDHDPVEYEVGSDLSFLLD